MRLTHATAVIGFCADLTDPDAKSLPVGTLVMGDVGDARVAAVVYAMPSSVEIDDFTRAMLVDVPALIRRQVDDALKSLSWDAPVDTVLFRLHDALKNSLHVVKVGKPQDDELAADAAPREVVQRVLDIAFDRLAYELTAAGLDPFVAVSKAPELRTNAVRQPPTWFPDARTWSLPRADGLGPLGAMHV